MRYTVRRTTAFGQPLWAIVRNGEAHSFYTTRRAARWMAARFNIGKFGWM